MVGSHGNGDVITVMGGLGVGVGLARAGFLCEGRSYKGGGGGSWTMYYVCTSMSGGVMLSAALV